jgi:essential nuclear protein 1
MPKATTPSLSNKRRHNPLEDDLLATGVLKNREGRPSKRADRKQAEEQAYVDAKSSRKILAMSRDLIDEEELQSKDNGTGASAASAFDFDPSRLEGGSEQDEEEFANEEAWGDEEDVVEEIEVDAADLETFNRFVTPTMNDDPLLTHGWDGKPGDGAEEQGPGTNLADLILAKIAEKEAMQGGRQEDHNPVEEDYELPPKVIEVFTKYV